MNTQPPQSVQNSRPNNSAQETPPKVHDIEDFKSAVYEMDYLSQCGFTEISSVAKLALIALESPNAHRNPEHIAQAFVVILGRANDLMNSINCEAENVECNCSDKRKRARIDAWCTFNNEKKSAAESTKEGV